MFGRTLGLSLVVGCMLVVSPVWAVPNVAHLYCLEMGYVVEDGYCLFPDGESCEVFDFLRGDCGAEYVHPVDCAAAGMTRGVAVECCEDLVELGSARAEGFVCQTFFGSFPVCSDCGDGYCDDWESVCNCEEDCGVCTGEGEAIPSVVDPGACCLGLELILPKSPFWFGIKGYCTADCGDGFCDSTIESDYNCPEDCVFLKKRFGAAATVRIPEALPADIEASAPVPTGDTFFSGCGVIDWRGPQGCTLFRADSGEVFAIRGADEFMHNDYVLATGTIAEDSCACWPVCIPGLVDGTFEWCPE